MMFLLTFVSRNGFEEVKGNIRTSANHGLQFVSREEWQKGYGHDPGHALAEASYRRIKLVQPEANFNKQLLDITIYSIEQIYFPPFVIFLAKLKFLRLRKTVHFSQFLGFNFFLLLRMYIFR